MNEKILIAFIIILLIIWFLFGDSYAIALGFAAIVITRLISIVPKYEIVGGKPSVDFYANLLRHIERLTGKYSKGHPTIKNATRNAHSLTYSAHKDIHNSPCDYIINIKIDGIQVVGHIGDKSHHVIADSLTTTPTKITDHFTYQGELFDGKIYIFDVLEFRGENVCGLPYQERIQFIDEITKADPILHKMKFDALDFTKFESYYKEQKKHFDTDGIIIVTRKTNYRHTIAHKWKPPSHNTIDFLLYKNKTGYSLLCGVNRKMYDNLKLTGDMSSKFDMANDYYFPVVFQHPYKTSDDISHYTPENKEDLHMKICEMVYEVDKGWKLIRVRDDRTNDVKSGYFGNHFRYVVLMFDQYFNPLDVEKFVTPPKKYPRVDNFVYYQQCKKYVFSELLKNHPRVLDLYPERGYNLHPLSEFCSELHCYQPDPDSASIICEKYIRLRTKLILHREIPKTSFDWVIDFNSNKRFNNTPTIVLSSKDVGKKIDTSQFEHLIDNPKTVKNFYII